MPATISIEQVKRVAQLARLGLTEAEAERAAQDLGNILSHFAQVQTIDTQGVPTSDDVTGLQNITRDDKAQTEVICTHADLLARAPELQHNQIKVKAVFE